MNLHCVVLVLSVYLLVSGCVRGATEVAQAEADAMVDVTPDLLEVELSPDMAAAEEPSPSGGADGADDGGYADLPEGPELPGGDSADGGDVMATPCVENCAGMKGVNGVFVSVDTVIGEGDVRVIADAVCDAEGDANFGAGTYVAFLGAGEQNAFEHLATMFPLAQGWVRWDGAPVAEGLAALASGFLWNPVAATSNGASVGDGVLALTSVNAGACTAGHPAAVGTLFADASEVACDAAWPVVCVQVDHAAVPEPPALGQPGARVAFVSTEAFDTSAGVQAADAVCRADAAAAGLPPGQYLALVATSTAAMVDRVDLSGTAWVDPTGRPLVAAAADLADVQVGVMAPLSREADGGFVGDNPIVVTGAPTAAQPGFGGHCDDWSADAGSASGVVAGFAGSGWVSGPAQGVECGGLARVYCFQRTANLVFVSNTTVTGRIDANEDGSIEEADALCQADAVFHGLTGSFMAYLAQGTTIPTDRLSAAGIDDVGWVRADGRPVASNLAALAQSQLWHPVRLHADRSPVVGDVWTGVDAGFGDPSVGEHCNGWTSDSDGLGRVGQATNGARYWHGFAPQGCGAARHLYCLQVDPAPPVVPPAASGRMAFTVSGWSPTSGLEAADALCQLEGSAAFGGGDYKAFLTPTTGTAAERFEPDGPPWVRPDGVRVAASNADVLGGGMLWAPISVDVEGAFDGSWEIATGAGSPTAPGDDASTCQGWNGMGSYKPTPPGYVTTGWFAKQVGNPGNCALTTTVMCLQE